MKIELRPIGYVKTEVKEIPRHWTVSDAEGVLIIDKQFEKGLKDIDAGQQLVVVFCFHESPMFTDDMLIQYPKHKDREMGVFSICSPRRPNPIGISVLQVLSIDGTAIHVKGIDMTDGTPIIDLKPNVTR